jgi:hypothetical protein
MSAPCAYWVGMDTPPDVDVAAFNAFYDKVHVPEVVAKNPGFLRATRYELLAQDARGNFGPRWLAMYEMQDEAAARGYEQRNDGPPEGRPVYTPGLHDFQPTIQWRLLWRQIFTSGTAGDAPHGIFIVGMNVPPDTTSEGLAEFNAFYSNVHVPEVMQWGDYTRAVRFELMREFAHAAPGSPRFLAVYEGDLQATEASQHRAAAPRPQPSSVNFTAGPPTWEQHDTRWRLVYRRVTG